MWFNSWVLYFFFTIRNDFLRNFLNFFTGTNKISRIHGRNTQNFFSRIAYFHGIKYLFLSNICYIEISKKTNVSSWSENIKTHTCLMFLDNFTRARILNSYPNGFCSLRTVLALQGTLVILIDHDKNIRVPLSSF